MSTKKILIISSTNELNPANWTQVKNVETLTMDEDEKAIEVAQQQNFDAIVINYNDNSLNHKKLMAILPILQPDVKIITLEGEAIDAVEAEIAAYFIKQRNDRIRRMLVLNDDALKGQQGLPSFSAN